MNSQSNDAMSSLRLELLTGDKVLAHMKTLDKLRGLTSADVVERLEKHGRNVLPEEPKTPFWQLVAAQFEDTMVRMLLMAAAISYGVSVLEGQFLDVVEPLIILLILVLNAIVGVFQETRAEEAIDALKSYLPSTALVIRDGLRGAVNAEELVPGDIVEVAVGQRVPADIRLLDIQSTTLRVNESILNGESEEVLKVVEEVSSPERYPCNSIFSGTSVVYGRASGVVIRTGTDTELGLIHGDVRAQDTECKTPLQEKLDEFGVLLSKVIGYICLVVFAVNAYHLYRHLQKPDVNTPLYQHYAAPLIHSLKVAVALSVAAIPEGLPAVVTTCLALGSRRLSRHHALVRDLGSVETLGRCSVICSDKTGTLTTGKMTVAEVACLDKDGSIESYRFRDTKHAVEGSCVTTLDGKTVQKPFDNISMEKIAMIAALCNESSLEYHESSGTTTAIGEATEAALLVMSEKLSLGAKEAPNGTIDAYRSFLQSSWKTVATLEFTRSRKSMSVCCVSDNGKAILFGKGAPEEMIARSNRVMLSNGKVVPMSDAIRQKVNRHVDRLAGHFALRCIGFAFKEVDAKDYANASDPSKFADLENDMILVGACGLEDPLRSDVSSAIQQCHSAGIRVIVITGDKMETAVAVCQKIGLLGDKIHANQVFSGDEFSKMSELQQRDAVSSIVLLYRTDPSHKLQLVTLLQNQRFICAMTGDGVNDSPALKKAAIGVAMGSGTEVAKAASNMILADDSFSTVVYAVRQGRSIYNNTKQFIRYLISSNIGEVACVLATGLCGLPEALTPIQLLWVNLVTDGLPATALSFNKPDADIMSRPPRSGDEPIVSGWMFIRYLIIGAYVGLSTVWSFLWWFSANGYALHEVIDSSTCVESYGHRCAPLDDPRTARAIALSTVVFVEMFNALNALSENSSIFTTAFSNRLLIYTILSSVFLHLMVMYVPFLADLFNIVPLGVEESVFQAASPWSVLVPTDYTEWKVVLLASFPVILIDEVLKLVTRVLLSRPQRKAC